MGGSDLDRRCALTNPEPGQSTPDAPTTPRPSGTAESAEYERLAHALSLRFAPHVEAAEALVRAAEQDVALARERLRRASEQAAHEPYRSDPLVFMRESVQDEVESVGRKTTPKKVRAAYRYLVDRALELAEGEVKGYEADQADADRERADGVQACLLAERVAGARLVAAKGMRDRVLLAEHRAAEGLALMAEKLAAQGEKP